MVLALPVKEQELTDKLRDSGLNDRDIDNQMAILAALVKKAQEGNVSAAKIIFNLVGVEVEQKKGEVRIVDDL